MRKAGFERIYAARVASWRAAWARTAERAHQQGKAHVPARRQEALMRLSGGEAEAVDRAAEQLAGELGISALIAWYKSGWRWPDPDAVELSYWPGGLTLPDDAEPSVRSELVRRQERPGTEGLAASALLVALADLGAFRASR